MLRAVTLLVFSTLALGWVAVSPAHAERSSSWQHADPFSYRFGFERQAPHKPLVSTAVERRTLSTANSYPLGISEKQNPLGRLANALESQLSRFADQLSALFGDFSPLSLFSPSVALADTGVQSYPQAAAQAELDIKESNCVKLICAFDQSELSGRHLFEEKKDLYTHF